jgi:hypothetical protein
VDSEERTRLQLDLPLPLPLDLQAFIQWMCIPLVQCVTSIAHL